MSRGSFTIRSSRSAAVASLLVLRTRLRLSGVPSGLKPTVTSASHLPLASLRTAMVKYTMPSVYSVGTLSRAPLRPPRFSGVLLLICDTHSNVFARRSLWKGSHFSSSFGSSFGCSSLLVLPCAGTLFHLLDSGVTNCPKTDAMPSAAKANTVQ